MYTTLECLGYCHRLIPPFVLKRQPERLSRGKILHKVYQRKAWLKTIKSCSYRAEYRPESMSGLTPFSMLTDRLLDMPRGNNMDVTRMRKHFNQTAVIGNIQIPLKQPVQLIVINPDRCYSFSVHAVHCPQLHLQQNRISRVHTSSFFENCHIQFVLLYPFANTVFPCSHT